MAKKLYGSTGEVETHEDKMAPQRGARGNKRIEMPRTEKTRTKTRERG